MHKTIRTELWKMSAMIVVLLGLGVYAHEFVLAGLRAKLALNLSIFIIAGVAAGIAFRHVIKLKNDVVAMEALKVDYGLRSRRPKDPYARPAVVFREPDLLGQSYRMITEELGKQDNLQISSSSAQNLLHEIDQRINDRKSTLIYFSGLMVFLGLLGAFMGLMKTVHSVSDLIGGMDMSGKAGPDAFGKMIEGMKAPLSGMSVGFSSSLFGLMTSMVLGALERCMTAAMKALRNEFEHWLSNVAALEGTGDAGAGQGSGAMVPVRRALESGAVQIKALGDAQLGASQAAARDAEQMRHHLDQLAVGMRDLTAVVAVVADPAPLLRPISETVTQLARNQIDMVAQFRGLYEAAAADRADLRAMLAALTARGSRAGAFDAGQLHQQLDRIAALQVELIERPAAPGLFPVGQVLYRRPPGRLARWFAMVLATLHGGQGGREARRMRRELRRALAANRRALGQLGRGMARRLDRIEAARGEDRGALGRLLARLADQQARLDGLTDQLAGRGDAPLASEFQGARRDLALLRRRMGLDFEAAPADPAPIGAAAPHTGTDG